MKITLRYLPKRLTKLDRKTQVRELLHSRHAYKHGKYYTRRNIPSFHSRKSNHVARARKLYHIQNIRPSNHLAKATGCKKSALTKIVNKGAGAYYSSGSRPNQTAQSWGLARLASAISGGKAAAVDYNILLDGCSHKHSRALSLARKARKKHGYGTHRVPKTTTA